MIRGFLREGEARIRLKVCGQDGSGHEIEAVIDTGYSGMLTLPVAFIKSLGLSWQTIDRGTLGDGSEYLFNVYEGILLWDGEERRAAIDEAETQPLVGMELLRGFELKMQVVPKGRITIKRIV